jgi:sulfate adenylyltransferase subunit 2
MKKKPAYLRDLEAQSVMILREVAAQFSKPVLMYSIGKDSAVLLHLAMKAFAPAKPPFALLHVDTGWKFQEMIRFRDELMKSLGLNLIVHTNVEGRDAGITPFSHGSARYTDVMKTQALKAALNHHQFDVAIGGARRDEEASRAKERIFSFRTANHRWDAKSQRPELWNLLNGRINPGESVRAFPMSNWTELDVWTYIEAENIPLVPLYFAAKRPVVERDGMLVMVDDDRIPLEPDETVSEEMVRFRTLGCYPLTGAIRSEASSVAQIIEELSTSRLSERANRAIDHDEAGSMEKKKQEGYF